VNRHFWRNAFRLLLHAAAYCLLDTLRHWLAAADAEAAHLKIEMLVELAGLVKALKQSAK
jgi:hypothetical protein